MTNERFNSREGRQNELSTSKIIQVNQLVSFCSTWFHILVLHNINTCKGKLLQCLRIAVLVREIWFHVLNLRNTNSLGGSGREVEKLPECLLVAILDLRFHILILHNINCRGYRDHKVIFLLGELKQCLFRGQWCHILGLRITLHNILGLRNTNRYEDSKVEVTILSILDLRSTVDITIRNILYPRNTKCCGDRFQSVVLCCDIRCGKRG